MAHLTVPAILLSVSTILSSASAFADKQEALDKLCKNPPEPLKELCENRGKPIFPSDKKEIDVPATQKVADQCKNPAPAMKAFCEQAMKAVRDLPTEQELQEQIMTPDVLDKQKSQMQDMMLTRDVWVDNPNGGRNNMRFFRTGDELKSFYQECASKGGQRMIPEGSPLTLSQGLLQGSCFYPKAK